MITKCGLTFNLGDTNKTLVPGMRAAHDPELSFEFRSGMTEPTRSDDAREPVSLRAYRIDLVVLVLQKGRSQQPSLRDDHVIPWAAMSQLNIRAHKNLG